MGEVLAAAVIVAVHVLGGGVWIGAMVFSVFVLHPRAQRFFTRDGEFEDFIFTVVHGARWKVVAGIAAIVGSGAALAVGGWSAGGHGSGDGWAAGGPWWRALVVAKVVLLAVSLGLFMYVSWSLWPRRVFAGPDELPAVRRRFWWVGVIMIAGNAANVGLGVLARMLRGAA